jgi:ribonuclease P protein component
LSLQRLPKPIFSSKNIKIFQVPAGQSELRIATPKNIFKLAVTRNKIKRQIKNIFHENNLHEEDSLFVIKVFEPFLLLSYQEASFEICKAVKS